MRPWAKRIGIICLIPVALITLISILLYIPPVQDFAVRTASKYAAKATGMQFEIGQIRLSFPLHLKVKNVLVIQKTDTLLNLNQLQVNISPLPLFKKEILIDAISLKGVRINSSEMIEGMTIQGSLNQFDARIDRIDLKDETIRLERVNLEDTDIRLCINDTTTKKDTATTSVNWKLYTDKIDIKNVSFSMQMDTLKLNAFINNAALTHGSVDLKELYYGAKTFTLNESSFAYNLNPSKPMEGFDPSHVDLNNINIDLEAFEYGDKTIRGTVKKLQAEDRSGLTIKDLTGKIESDSLQIKAPNLLLTTPYSEIRLMANIPWSALSSKPKGSMNTILKANIAPEDALLFLGTVTDQFKIEYPKKDIDITVGVEGNLESMRLREMSVFLDSVFDLNLTGELHAIQNQEMRSGTIEMSLETYNLDFILAMLPEAQRDRLNLPSFQLTGQGALNKGTYTADLRLAQDKGLIELKGDCNPIAQSYNIALTVDSFQLHNFLPYDSLYQLAAEINGTGKGFDPFNSSTFTKLEGSFYNIQYGSMSVSDIHFNGSLEKNKGAFHLVSNYPPALMDIELESLLLKNKVEGHLKADINRLDLYAMHLLNDSLATSFKLKADLSTDLKKSNAVDLSLTDWKLSDVSGMHKLRDIYILGESKADTTFASVRSGDLLLSLNGNKDYQSLIGKFSTIATEVKKQIDTYKEIDIPGLKASLPAMDFSLTAGQDNPIYNFSKQYNISFDSLLLQMHSSPDEGLFVDMDVFEFMRDTIKLDSICFIIHQDTAGLKYDAKILKKKYRQQQGFSADLNGLLHRNFAEAELTMLNESGKTGFNIGAHIDLEKEGYRLHLFPEKPILAFRQFEINPGNYVYYKDIKDITADLRLIGEENASLWIHSTQKEDNKSELHLELSQINLADISKSFENLPDLRGMLSADLQYEPSDSSFTIMADLHIDTLFYDNGRVGELMFNAVYLPLNKKEHQMDMHLFRDNAEIALINAYYRMGATDYIDGSFQITDLPFDMVNPFIPNNMAKISGNLIGNMNITGSTGHPVLNGYLELDSTDVFVSAVGSTFHFGNDKISVENNLITFDNFDIYSAGNNPFIIGGTIDIHDLRKMHANLSLKAENMQLLNAKKTKESLVYGKLIVNLNSTIKGPLESLAMRGNLQLLGGTNITYVMQESPITAQDRLSGLVTFTDFADTLLLNQPNNIQNPLPINGMDILMTIEIDQSVRANVDITPDQSNRIELEGGGDLSFQYTPQGQMYMNGRYTLSGGTVKYTIPIIPLKVFNIQNGSYVQWTGNLMNPTLNVTATEKVRASVSYDNEAARMVAFNVGVSIQQTLENLKLLFVINAPEDQAVQQQIGQLNQEQQSQIAVTMLITGMYVDSNSSSTQGSNFNMGSALNAVLQSEINNIAGSAFKSMDISVGMEQYNQSGVQRSDLSFSISKRFYNDRISIILGGRLTSRQDAESSSQTQPFIDNVSVEYRLDRTGTRYVKIFYDVNYQSLLEGQITEAGVGVVLRKKMLHLRDLFVFKKNKNKPKAEEVKQTEQEKKHEETKEK